MENLDKDEIRFIQGRLHFDDGKGKEAFDKARPACRQARSEAWSALNKTLPRPQ